MARYGRRTKMELKGLREMQRALQQLPDELQKPLVTEALMDAAEPMRDTAISLAADADPIGVGLVDNIIISDKLTETQQKAEGSDRKDEARVYVGVDGEKPGIAPHGILVEFGTGPRVQQTTGKEVGEMPAQPFMRPAFDSTARSVILRFAKNLRPLIERAAKAVAARNH